MKKIMLTVLAAAALVACNNEETLKMQSPYAIDFADASVEGVTRADAADPSFKDASNPVTSMKVWAFLNQPKGTVLADETVTKSDNEWTYTNTQYWVPGEKNTYYFAALAPVANAHWQLNTDNASTLGAGVVTFTNVNGSEDLLYAATSVAAPKSVGQDMDPVKFYFSHLLSKVKFTFKNSFPNSNAEIVVRNIRMTAPAKATINLAVDNWWDNQGDWMIEETDKNALTLDFGTVGTLKSQASGECAQERLTIPAGDNQTYTVTFTVDLYMGEVKAQTFDLTSTISGVAIEMGKAYNFTAEISPEKLNLDEIDLDVEVKGWVEESKKEFEYSIFQDRYGNYVTSSTEGLIQIAEGINDGSLEPNINVVLAGDIDLSALSTRSTEIRSNWTPIGTSEKPFTGTFDGKGYTIKNLTLVESEAKEGKAFIGFFGYAKNATIKNVTFENVNINIPCLDIDHSQGHIGAVAGSLEGTSIIENVTVKGDIKVEATQDANGASRVAVVAGGNSYGDVIMKNVHVFANEGSYLIANNNTGALAGQLQGKSVFENCSSNINVTVNKFFAGGIIGLAAGDQTFINCHTTGDIAVIAGREGRAHDQYRVGGIAGGWADGAKNVCTLTNCSYTGNISGKNSDGSVANPLDYAGYVGRGYTLNGCQGSTVKIDNYSYIQKYNTAAEAGIYTIKINDLIPVATADELVAALEANEGVLFLNDIKIEPASMSNAYGKTGINIKNGQTIDGDGHTLDIKGAGGTWDSGINTTGGLIKNITVTGSFRGIFINHNSTHSEKVVLENVTITGTTYTISCDQGKYQGLEATNCTFNGWTSYAKTLGEAKFVNCSFGEGNGYKYCRPYSKTEFVECTFCTGYTVDQTQAEVTFTNCSF